jgi:hypothetical protein
VKAQRTPAGRDAENPALSYDHYHSLTRQLEYFDLRELQDTITNKALRPGFESRFGMDGGSRRPGLVSLLSYATGFVAVARVYEITREDGEEALLRFRRVLASWTSRR